jgi:uncharacterized protein YjiS (DUF1127 family)
MEEAMFVSSAKHLFAPDRFNSAWRGAGRLMVGTAVRLAREIKIRRDLHHVSELSDHMLHDIGLARGGVEGAVRFGRWTEAQRMGDGPR